MANTKRAASQEQPSDIEITMMKDPEQPGLIICRARIVRHVSDGNGGTTIEPIAALGSLDIDEARVKAEGWNVIQAEVHEWALAKRKEKGL